MCRRTIEKRVYLFLMLMLMLMLMLLMVHRYIHFFSVQVFGRSKKDYAEINVYVCGRVCRARRNHRRGGAPGSERGAEAFVLSALNCTCFVC